MLIADDKDTSDFAIEGLCFVPNFVRDLGREPGWFTAKLLSSRGPLVSDFVTHEPTFRYSSYGIHIGQDDRLTFLGGKGTLIEGHFVDCRRGSPTLHAQVQLSFIPSIARHLVIPRGVAHTFDGLETVVTRDEPVWHSSRDNEDWNVDNDLISVDRDRPTCEFPVVRPNEHRLPDSVHQFQSRLSQSLLETPRTYLARYLLTIGGRQQYVMFDVPAWGEDEEREVDRLLEMTPIPGVELRRSRYALTGRRSWTLVPNTQSCVADVLFLPPAKFDTPLTKALHRRTKVWYTFLSAEGAPLDLEFLDCRGDSPTFGNEYRLTKVCDPRFSIAIEHGLAYSIHCRSGVFVRVEQELFVDQNEPRADLPLFGQDLVFVERGRRPNFTGLPRMLCPAELSRVIARHEADALAVSKIKTLTN